MSKGSKLPCRAHCKCGTSATIDEGLACYHKCRDKLKAAIKKCGGEKKCIKGQFSNEKICILKIENRGSFTHCAV